LRLALQDDVRVRTIIGGGQFNLTQRFNLEHGRWNRPYGSDAA
jgi:hypothetical protein